MIQLVTGLQRVIRLIDLFDLQMQEHSSPAGDAITYPTIQRSYQPLN